MNERDIFMQAPLDAEPDELDAWLEEACQQDAELKRKVLALIEADRQTVGLLDEAPIPEAAQGKGRSGEAPIDRVPNYRLLQKIGEGGFGVVFMADQLAPVKRRVALKIIKQGMDTREVIARFEAERQALAMMDHPNIAKVLDAGATGSGRPYFAMELVKGIPITEFCDQQQFDLRRRLELFRDVCSAINHAHQKGIIHRDLKPSNVMVTLVADKPVPKVIDFGIAKATQNNLTDKTLFTRFEQFLGTPAYMSPEQAALSSVDIDTRSDIYSLGVLLYELLAGVPPFDPKTLISAGHHEMRRIIAEEEPPKPSTRVTRVRSGAGKPPREGSAIQSGSLKGDLDWIVMKAIEKDRTRRYETANAFAADVGRFLSTEPVLAAAPTTRYRLHKFARRHKASLVVSGMVVAVLIIATSVSLWQAARATQAAVRSRDAEYLARQRLDESQAAWQAEKKARQSAELAREEAERISTFLTKIFESPLPQEDGRKVTVAKILDRAVMNLDAELGDQPRHKMRLQNILSRTYQALGIYSEANRLREQITDYHVKTYGLANLETLRSLGDLFWNYNVSGESGEKIEEVKKEMISSCEAVLNAYPDRKDLDADTQHSILFNVARGYRYAGRHTEALKFDYEMVQFCKDHYGRGDRRTMWAEREYASSLASSARVGEAIEMMKEQLDFLERSKHGPEGRHTLSTADRLANYYGQNGQYSMQRETWEKIVAIRRRIDGAVPVTFWSMRNLAFAYGREGNHDEQVAVFEELRPMIEEVQGLDHPATLNILGFLADAYRDATRPEDEINLREEILKRLRAKPHATFAKKVAAMRALADLYLKVGQTEKGQKLKEEAAALAAEIDPLVIPKRPADLSGKRLDLSTYFTDSLAEPKGWARDPLINLSQLARTFAPRHGVNFDLRGAIRLESGRLKGIGKSINQVLNLDLPPEVTGIEVGQSTPAIHFLASCMFPGEKGEVIARWIMHYADGTEVGLPVKLGPDGVGDWVEPGFLNDNTLGWRGPIGHDQEDRIRRGSLSELIWENPHPEKVIATIDFVSTQSPHGVPFLVAITLE